MKQRTLPPAGRGEPIISAAGRFVNLTDRTEPSRLTLRLSISRDAEIAGREIVERVRIACNADDFETVSTLLVLFPSVVERVPEFHALMDELTREDRADALREIRRVPSSRGRPRGDEFYFVALIEHVLDERKLTRVTDALLWLANYFAAERAKPRDERPPELPFVPSTKTLQNTHSRLGDLFRLWSGSLCVPAELLTVQPWAGPPVQTPQELESTTLSSAIVFHSPNDIVTEPKKEN